MHLAPHPFHSLLLYDPHKPRDQRRALWPGHAAVLSRFQSATDNNGFVESETWATAAPTTSSTTTCNGNLLTISDYNGDFAYTYDDLGRLETYTDTWKTTTTIAGLGNASVLTSFALGPPCQGVPDPLGRWEH